MPLPMVHLAIGMHMSELTTERWTPAFLLGSIAPDAIHVRPNTNRADKDRTHLLGTSESETRQRIRGLLLRHWREASEATRFAEGYAAHLLADRIWVQTLFGSFQARIPQGMSHKEQRSLYYRETDWIDLDLYQRMVWREEAWRKLAAANPIDFEPLLTAEEIGQWRTRTLEWYGERKQEVFGEPVHMSGAEVEDFVAEAARAIVTYFDRWKASSVEQGS